MTTDTIEIDLTGGPTVAKYQTPVALGLAAIKDASTLADLEHVVAALRKLTETEKAALRPAVRARAAVLKQVAELVVPAPAPAPAPEVVPTLVASAPAPAEPTLTVDEQGAVTHTPTGPSVFDSPRPIRRTAPPPAPEPRVTRKELTAGNLIAGASEDATGVFLSWSGFGEMHITAIEDALYAARAPTEWAPARKSRHFHAAEALKPMNMNGLVVRAERGGTKVLRSPVTGTQRRYMAAWSVMLPSHSAVGAEAGKTVARFQLATSGELESSCEPGYEAHCNTISEDFTRRVRDEVLPAGDVTKWLRSVLIERLGAVRVGGNYYVRADHKDMAERICFALANTWGVDWMLPALPVATSNQLRAGLVRGFVQEVQDLLHEVEKARGEAHKAKKLDITPAAAASFLLKLRDVNERAKAYVEVLGPDSVGSVSRSIKAAVDLLEPLCDSTAERFAALEPYEQSGPRAAGEAAAP